MGGATGNQYRGVPISFRFRIDLTGIFIRNSVLTGRAVVLNIPGLMAHALADQNSPIALARSRQAFDFKGRISDFDRLAAVVRADLAALDPAEWPARWQNSPVRVELDFGFADVREALPQVTGSATVSVPAVCQRCLELCHVNISASIRYLLLEAGRESAEASGYEVWELDGDRFRPSELVQEVLLMNLPVAARHDSAEDCGSLVARIDTAEQDDASSTRPFADLRTRLQDRK